MILAQANTIDAGLGTAGAPVRLLTMSVPTIVGAGGERLAHDHRPTVQRGVQRGAATLRRRRLCHVDPHHHHLADADRERLDQRLPARHPTGSSGLTRRPAHGARPPGDPQPSSLRSSPPRHWCRCSPHSPASWPASCSMPPTARFGEIWSRLPIQWMCCLMRCETRDGWNTRKNGCRCFVI